MCTAIRFTDTSENMYFGRNLDWVETYGEEIVFTPSGFPYRCVFDANERRAPFAVMGVGSVMNGNPLYFDCANERGLAIAGLNFPGCAQFPRRRVEGACNVATFEFPLWVTRNFETVDEIERALENVELVSPVAPGQPESLLHWIIADATRSIVVERTASGLHVYDDPVDTLTNQPELPWHLENLRNYLTSTSDVPAPATWGALELSAWGSGSGMRGIPGDASSVSRFVRAAYANANYPAKQTEAENVARLFHTLGSVQMVEGCAKVADGRFEKTLFTSGYSAATNTYYANTYDRFEIRAFPFAEFDADDDALQTRPLYICMEPDGTAPRKREA